MKFIVQCIKISRQKKYKIFFQYHEEVINRIKELEFELRKWDSVDKCWILHVKGLFELIKKYKNSEKILFSFPEDNGKADFIELIKKIKSDDLEKEKRIKILEEKKEEWVKLKDKLERDFEKYRDITQRNLNDGVKLYPYQIAATMFINEAKNVLLALDMGLGKANPIDSKLLTPNGWIKMGDVKVGDLLIGSDGKSTKVLAVYPQGEKDIYELKFNDNTTAQCCEEHLWNVNSPTRIYSSNKNIKDYPYQTKTLREIIDSGLQFKNGNYKHHIPIVKPIEFDEKNLKIDPYVLGCILSNGSITIKNIVGFTLMDNQIINEIQERLPTKHNLVLIKNTKIQYYLSADGNNNLIDQYLREYKLKGCNSHNKFIPHDYKFSSINQRLEILRGIMDSDGIISSTGMNIDLTLSSKQLIDDVKFIVQSLGGIVRYKTRTSRCKEIDIEPTYHIISIKLSPNIIPFKLNRKVERYVSATKYLPSRAIKQVNYIGKKEAQCITVDAKDNLYLMYDCVVTHNTISSIAYVEMNNFKRVFVITPNSLKFNYFNEVEKFTKSKAYIITSKTSKYKNKYTLEESKYIIVNYEYFNPKDKNKMDQKIKELNIGKIDVLICDESQNLKNTGSNTYKNFKRIFNKKIFKEGKMSKVFLSGTPAPNRAHELYSVLNQISPIDFATKKYFNEYYCGMTYDLNGFGWVSNNENSKLEELFYKISPYTYRKRKSEVLTDLPDKIYQKIILELEGSESKIYGDIEQDVVDNLDSIGGNTNPLTIMLKLRQYTSTIKINYIKEMIDNVIEQGEKIVVVDMFKNTLNELHKIYPTNSGLHTGDQTVEERAELVAKFQDPKSDIKIFFASIQTANYGLTLTEASKMVIITLPFSVGQYDQVADRCILKGELVLTKEEGYLRIEDVKIGDLVYTHKGNWKRVLNIKNRIERNKRFYDINYKGFFKPLRCTEDHKIYVYDIHENQYVWVEAKDLNINNHYMFLSKVELENYKKKFKIYKYESKIHNKLNINKEVELNNDLLYAFGRYVGDGWIDNHQVNICGHIDEYYEVLNAINAIKKSFNIEHHGEYFRGKVVSMTISSMELKYNFNKWFNSGAENKKIPDFIFHLNKIEIESFLRGYYDADGYQRKNTQQASTVSKYLSYQLVLIEGMLMNNPTLIYNEHAQCWSVEYSIIDKIKRDTLIKNIDGNILYPINEIKEYKSKRNDERVYDLEVEDDNSFVVGLSTVHNCHRIGQKSTVNIYPLIFNNTLDEYVFDVIESKRKEIVKALDNEDYESNISESLISDVINKLKNKYK